ncbi:MAG TPA: hypothetical protein VG077_14415 [Verrucomicrobiae bacterium]|nr:hypothetical protein [Verrucomicrobiae bacterium]
MKIRVMNRLSGRIITTMAALSAIMMFFAGCVVTSIYPYYRDKDLVFDPAMLGNWVEAGQTNENSEYVRFEPMGTNGYWATVLGGSETNSFEVHLFRLKAQLFVDSFPTNRSLDFVPVHQVSKVMDNGPVLETANLNYDWLAKLLEKNPRAIRHMMLRDNPGDEHGRIVLTADTKELQRFILKNINNTNAWKEPSQFKRLN